MFDSPQVKWNYFLYNRPFILIPIRNGHQRCYTRVTPKNLAIPTRKHLRRSLPPQQTPKRAPNTVAPAQNPRHPQKRPIEEHPRTTGSMPQEYPNELLAIAIFFLKFLLKRSGLAKLCLIFFFLPNHSRKSNHWSKIPGAWKKGLEI